MFRHSTIIFALLAIALAEAGAGQTVVQPKEVAAAYLAAIQAGNLDAAGALFAIESTIFESGGVEGTWQNYRDHHLGPEVDAIARFTIDFKQGPEVAVSKDGTFAVVAWPIGYSISLKDERVIESRGTVTFVMIRYEEAYLIRHLHWSSRRTDPVP